jgi:1-deoxy-D-xylulose-5-phosphate reductoisomerase
LTLAYQALRAGGSAPALLNAANEVAVAAFLEGRLPFLSIADTIARVLERIPATLLPDLDSVMEADGMARRMANDLVLAAK